MPRVARLLSLLVVMLFFACPKASPGGPNLSGSDEERMDSLAAQLEELRARAQASQPKCDDWCSMTNKVKGISTDTCEIARRHADRSDMQQKCTLSQETFASFNESCAGCKG